MKKLPPTEAQGTSGRARSCQNLIEQYGPGVRGAFRRISLAELFPNLSALRGGVFDKFPLVEFFPKLRPRPKTAQNPFHQMAVAVLDEYLAAGGWFVIVEDGVYDVIYPNLAKSVADLKHGIIIQEIERRIGERAGRSRLTLGDRPSCELSQRDFEKLRSGSRQTVVQTLDVSEVLFGKSGDDTMLSKRITKVVREILAEYLAVNGYFTRLSNAQILLIFPEISRSLAQMKRDAIANEILRRLNSKGGTKGDSANDPVAIPAVASREPSQNLKFRTKPRAELVNTWNRAVAEAASYRGRDDLDEARAMPVGWSWSYQPLWRVRNRLLTAYVLRGFPPTSEAFRGVVTKTSLAESMVNADEPSPVDLPFLDLAVRDLHRTLKLGRQAVVIVPVHFATLDRTSLRTHYLHICAQLPENARRYLVPEIVGVPPDLIPFRLEERINQLRHLSRTILVRASLLDQRFRQWRNFYGLHTVGIDISLYRGSETVIMQSLEQFAAAAEGVRLHTYAYGISSLSLTTATVVSGFDYVGGDAITPPTHDPLQVAEFDMAMLYPSEPSPTAIPDEAPCGKP